MPQSKSIKVGYLARVEGEASLLIDVEQDRVQQVQLKIFEPPRFFEAFLRGRDYSEAPDITARICGICPVAYQMSSVHAMERAFGVKVDGQLRELRRLLYCGEWIESHCLHMFMLHAPDFLGFPSAIEMARVHPEIVEIGLRIKKAGNDIVNLVGGREIHPINVRVGGFYRCPTNQEMQGLLPALTKSREEIVEAIKWTAGLNFQEFEQDYTFVSLRHPDEYPYNEGRIVSNRGLDIDASEYEQHFIESHAGYTNALHGHMKDGSTYLVGPLARFNNCFDQLPDSVKELAESVSCTPPVLNPFRSIIVRGLETMFALEEALRVIEQYEPPPLPYVPFEPKASVGWAVSEAPRGSLYHRYKLSADGKIEEAQIVPPTSQNQTRIEDDLTAFLPDRLEYEDEQLTWECEQLVRSYDPCISCATHFLDVKVNRT